MNRSRPIAVCSTYRFPTLSTAGPRCEDLTVIADRGYFKGEEMLKCHEAGITTYVCKPETSGAQAAGRFGRRDFHYDPTTDEYRCPAGDRLIWRMTTQEKGQTLHRYWSSHCQSCRLKSQCTPSDTLGA